MGGGIRKNGDFINTAFVEKALSEIDAVADVYVYGHSVSEGLAPGEKDIVAAVVATDSAHFDPAAVIAACRDMLDANSVPDFLQIVAEIPKTASEKPQERFLVDAFSTDTANIYSSRGRQND